MNEQTVTYISSSW